MFENVRLEITLSAALSFVPSVVEWKMEVLDRGEGSRAISKLSHNLDQLASRQLHVDKGLDT